MLIHFDAETLPTNDPAVIAELEAAIKPPATYSKPESIAKWMEENKAQALAEAVHKTGLNGLYGRICVIGYAFDDEEPFAVSGDDEKELLESFYSHVFDRVTQVAHHGLVEGKATFVGHNLIGFDLPFLKHRSIINRVKPPKCFLDAFNAKPWGNEVADTMLMWSSDPHKRGSMDKLCRAFGIPGKGDFDGSQVAQEWACGDRNKVVEYCKDDVKRTREIYKRIMFM